MQHVSLEVHKFDANAYYVMEKVAFPHPPLHEIIDNWEDEVVIQLPDTCICFDEIFNEHHKATESNYILGANDCRHHALHMLDFCYKEV